MEYQTTTFRPSLGIPGQVNLQPPTQVSPTSNTRGTPMIAKQYPPAPEFQDAMEYPPRFQANEPVQALPPATLQSQQQPPLAPVQPTLAATSNPFDTRFMQEFSWGPATTEQRYRDAIPLPPGQEEFVHQYPNESQQGGQALPISTGMNSQNFLYQTQRVPISFVEPQSGQHSLQGLEYGRSQLATGVSMQGYTAWHHVHQEVVPQQSFLQQPVQWPIQQPAQPVQQPMHWPEPVQQQPFASQSIQSTQFLPHTHPPANPAFRGELYKNFIQRDNVILPYYKTESPYSTPTKPVITQQAVSGPLDINTLPQPQSEQKIITSGTVPPQDIFPTLDTLSEPASPDETLPNFPANLLKLAAAQPQPRPTIASSAPQLPPSTTKSAAPGQDTAPKQKVPEIINQKVAPVIESNPSTKEGWVVKLFQEYAVEIDRLEAVGVIEEMAKETDIYALELSLEKCGVFTAEDIMNVKKRASEKLERIRQGKAKVGELSEATTDTSTALKVQNVGQVVGTVSTSKRQDTVISSGKTPAATISGQNMGDLKGQTTESTLESPQNWTHVEQLRHAPGLLSRQMTNNSSNGQITGTKAAGEVKTSTQDPPPTNDTTSDVPRTFNGSNQANENADPNPNGYVPIPPTSGPNGTQNSNSAPFAPKIKKRRGKLPQEKTIAHALPYNLNDMNLHPHISSWPINQIARTILIAAGKDIPNEEATRPLNMGLESLKTTWPQLKNAELTTLEWDVIDPPPVDMLTAVRRKLEVMKNSSATRDPFAQPPTMGSLPKTVPSYATPRTNTNVVDFTKFRDIDNGSSFEPITIPPLPALSQNGSEVSGTSASKRKRGRPRKVLPTMVPEGKPLNELEKSMFHRSPSSSKAIPKSAPTTPIQNTPNSTTKLTPQVIITPTKTTTPVAAIVIDDDDDVMDITPMKRTRRRSTSSPLAKRATASPITRRTTSPTAKRRTASPVAKRTSSPLTKHSPISKKDIPPTIPLDTTDSSSSDECPIILTPSPENPTKRDIGYKSYPCKWQNCHADLHSFETLEQHVLKIHGKFEPKTNVSPPKYTSPKYFALY